MSVTAPTISKIIPAERLTAFRAKLARYTLLINRQKQTGVGGLLEFVRYFWHILEPSTPLIEGWPLEAICLHLEAIAFGDIKRLLVVVPPGFCKSLLTDVFFPAWLWSAFDNPQERIVAFSYAASLTERDNARFRDLLISFEFQEMWGHKFTLRKIGETKVTNDKTGWKLASSVGGVGTGERGSIVVLDDPHSIKQVESEVVRKETVRWFREAMSNRLNDMETDSIVVIMQRSHEEDVAGVIISEDLGYCVLLIDMEFDSARQTAGTPNEAGWVDPRSEEGELAWPERFSVEVCKSLQLTIGPYAWAAQYQQMPSPRGGGIIKSEWWQPWDQQEAQRYGLEWTGERKEFPQFELVVGSLDTSFGEKQENDYNALTVWGVWIDRNKNRRAMLMFAWNKRLPLHGKEISALPNEAKVNFEQRQREQFGLIQWIADTAKRYKVRRLLIENATRGRDVANEINRLYVRENWGCELIDPVRDKVSRTHSIVPLFTDNVVWAPDTKWANAVIDNCKTFPKAAHDDLHDTVTMFLNWSRENGILLRGDEMSAALEDEQAYKPPMNTVAQHYGV